MNTDPDAAAPSPTTTAVLVLAPLLDSMVEGVLIVDRGSQVVSANEAAAQIFGASQEELLVPLGTFAERFALRERGVGPTSPIAARALRGEAVLPVERVIRTPGGMEKHIRTSAAPLRDESGAVSGALVLVSDITATKVAEERARQHARELEAALAERDRAAAERRRGEDALRESEQRARAMFDHAALGIVEVNEKDRFVAVNERVCRILGYRPEELLGKTLHEITAPEDRERTRELNAQVHGGDLDTFDYEKRYLCRDGSPIWVHLTVSAVRDARGKLMRAIATVEDISARKAAEADREKMVGELREANERLLQADRRKDEFLGMLSHELRNPLSPIRNSIYILASAPPDSPQAHRARAVIDRQVTHLTRLVDDLLDVTRIARGKIELRRARVDLNELVRGAGEDHLALFQDRGIELEVRMPAEAAWVHGDATRLTQIVGNLLQNAAKFTPRGGRVSLAAVTDAGWAEVRVRDTGSGIEPDILPKVFEPFVQAERTLARTQGGLGLGLALVKGLAEMHGGSVRAASEGHGSGAEIVVRLPLARVATGARASEAAAVHPQRRRVLVVDDNADAAETLAELVRMLGHETLVAHDGPSAVEKARASRPDVVLCDIGLPGMSGYEVARTLRSDEALAGARLVAVSGYAQPEDVKQATEAGFDRHVAKPPDPAQIEELLI